MGALITLAAGLFGGAGATLIWETVIKPRRDSRAFARLLLTELAVNRGIAMLEIAAHEQDPNRLPAKGVRLYATIFESSAIRLADLAPGVAALTYVAYRYVDRVNETNSRYWSFVETVAHRPRTELVDRALTRSKRLHLVYLRNSVIHIDKVRAALVYASLPVWSIRRRRLKSSVERYVGEMAKFIVGPDSQPADSDSPLPN